MDLFVCGIDTLQKLAVAIGGGLLVVGLVQFMLAPKDHIAGGKSIAANMVMGGEGFANEGTGMVKQV